jgi:hypothetical protein
MKGLDLSDLADPGNILFWLLLPISLPYLIISWIVGWIG